MDIKERFDIDIHNLDKYLYLNESLLGKDILNWCISNKNSSDFDKKYAANELYNNYFKDSKSLNLNNYYYITYCNIFVRRRVYTIIRDTEMSPKYDKTKDIIKFKDLKRLITRQRSIIEDIRNLKVYDETIDNKKIAESLNLQKKRLKKLGVLDSDDLKRVFYNGNNYKKYQLYVIVKNASIDLKTLRHNLQQIEDVD